jgi:hypothetical protein
VCCESRVSTAVAWGQFGNPEEGERPSLEGGTRVVKRQQTGNTQCVYSELQTVRTSNSTDSASVQ